MSDHYFTDKELTDELFLALPEGTLYAITNSILTRMLQIGEATPMSHRPGDWEFLMANLKSEHPDDDYKISSFENWDELDKWQKTKSFEKNFGA